MESVNSKVEKQSFRLFQQGEENTPENNFTIEASGTAKTEVELMVNSIHTIMQALNEDLSNDYEARQIIAKGLLLQVADFAAGNTESNIYATRINQKAILVGMTNLL